MVAKYKLILRAVDGEGASVEKYTLIVTEKPDAARRIADALDSLGKPEKIEETHFPFREEYPFLITLHSSSTSHHGFSSSSDRHQV